MTVFASLGVSMDGYVAGPNAGPANNLGDGGHRIRQWMYDLKAWKERQGRPAGETNRDNELLWKRGSSMSSRSTSPLFCLASVSRLFDHAFATEPGLEIARVVDSPAVTHVRYRIS